VSRRFRFQWTTLSLLIGLLFPTFLPSALPSALAAATNPTSVTLAGSLGHTIPGCTDWQWDCAAAHLTEIGNGIWRGVFTIPAGEWEYKLVINDDWSESYTGNHRNGGGNTTLSTTGATIRFYYDRKTNAVLDSATDVIAVAAGSFQSELGCPGDWDPACVRSLLTDVDGDGTYSMETTGLLAGSYEGKVALNESWDENYGQGGVRDGPNIPFTVLTNGAKVTFRYNASTHAALFSAGHAQDNNVEYDGLRHDSRDTLYRTPGGAINPGTPVSLRLRTFHNDLTSATIRLYDTAIGAEDKQPMILAARNVDCFDTTIVGSTCDYWQYTYTPQKLGTTYYRFILTDGTSTAYYADNGPRYGGVGQATPSEQDIGFRLNAVDPQFRVIPWMQDGVMYQIFPDRFRNGETGNDPKTTDPRYDYPAPANATPAQIRAATDAQIQRRSWNTLPEGYCRAYSAPATACNESPKGRDYYGGDLKGITEKLDYLKSVGITILYLNPIFESGSNHGYDTRDFLRISRYFGEQSDFRELVKEGKQRGIRVVLDGVFNHLSSDSLFFDRYHHYATIGACESTASPYRSWFVFRDVTPGTGTCVDSQNRANAATYDGWANFDSIPVIVKRDPIDPNKPYAPVAQYFYKDTRFSVAGYWLNRGAAGWRFDVMTDGSFPTSYWQELRTITKGINPDITLIAEAWHWYDNLPLTHGEQADTAMGYRFRNAVLGLLGAVDDKGFDEEGNPNLPPSTFQKRLESIREDYADATYYTFQNILDSHDTKRLLWSLTPGQENREQKEFNAANVAKGKARQSIAALVQMTVPGTPTIYYGDEVAVTGADDPDDRRTFPWRTNAAGGYINTRDPLYFDALGDHTMLNWYRKLALIRKLTPVLRQGKMTFLLADDTNKTVSYALRQGDNLAIMVINRNENSSQTITIPTAAYLRNGVTLIDALSGKIVTTTNGSFSITLGTLQGAIFILVPRQDITGPTAPTGLTASAQNGVTSSVNLSWNSNGSAGYNIYRSPLQAGGYVKIGTANGSSYTDTSVNNGTTYYYTVRGVDALGNEGAGSNEANATPAFPIGYAVLQYPKTITQAITSSYTTVYGQTYIDGLTNAGGDPSSVLAQVGYGAPGSNPATWTTWKPMSYNAGHTGDNNYEYQGSLRAEAIGTYDYLVRFSDDGGRSWAYGDQDGFYPGESGTDMPGVLIVNASSDTTAPSTPVASIDYGAGSLTINWSAAIDANGIAEYRIYRGTSAGGEGATPVAIVSGTTLSFVDTSVSAGKTYYYIVKAFDTALNASSASNEVSETVRAKIVLVTFRVRVPAFTPPGDTIYITGQSQAVSPDPLCGYCGGNASTAMHETSPGSRIWEITLGIPDGTQINYKYTRGTYNFVEEWGSITGFTNRVNSLVKPNSPTDLTQLFDDTSDTNADENHRAVQNWRDPLVSGTTPTNGAVGTAPAAINVTFNWDVTPEAANTTDFSGAIAVSRNGTAVAGIVTHNAVTKSLTFTPSATLVAGSYSVTVDHIVSLTQQNDGVNIRTPYTFTFTVN